MIDLHLSVVDIFQAAGNTDDNSDRFTVSVSAGRMHSSASLTTNTFTLSYPGALLDENELKQRGTEICLPL